MARLLASKAQAFNIFLTLRTIWAVTAAKGGILSQKLLNSWDQFHFFLRLQVLVIIQEKLELGLKAQDKLVKRDCVLFIGQLCQFSHDLVSAVTSDHNGIQNLNHDEEVVNLFLQEFFN